MDTGFSVSFDCIRQQLPHNALDRATGKELEQRQSQLAMKPHLTANAKQTLHLALTLHSDITVFGLTFFAQSALMMETFFRTKVRPCHLRAKANLETIYVPHHISVSQWRIPEDFALVASRVPDHGTQSFCAMKPYTHGKPFAGPSVSQS
jgi:hypothetical protein